MNLKLFQEASSTLAKFLLQVKSANDKNGLIWYHAMCLDFLLDTTMTILPFQSCCEFFVAEMTEEPTKSRQEACARFYANCLLWNMRHGCHVAAKFWQRKLMKIFEVNKVDSITGTYTGLRLLESLTLEVASFISTRKITELRNVENELKFVSKLVTAGVKNSNLFAERLKLHRLHLKMVKTYNMKNLAKLEKLEESAIKSKDFLALGIIKFTQLAWNKKLSENVRNYWINHSTNHAAISVDQLSASDRVFTFSLPLTFKINCKSKETKTT